MNITPRLITRARLAFAGLLLLPALAFADRMANTVFTATNATDGNRILVFDRKDQGALKLRTSYPTGGMGTGAGLGSQSAIAMSDNDDWLLAVNPASNEISVFSVNRQTLVLTDVVSSGGKNPVSVTIDHNLVYVLNGGGAVGDHDGVAGFYLSKEGRLTAIPGSWRALSGASVGPAQIGFSPSGDVLVVTEKGTNLIDRFVVSDNGLLGARAATVSSGATPYGFSFGPKARLYVSEAFGGAANASAVSSYQTWNDGSIAVISASVATHQSAACWLVLARDGRFAYTTNTASNTISGYAIANNGSIKLLQPSGASASTGSTPIDVAVTDNDRFLYSLNAGDGSISGFAISYDGKLTPVETETGLPAGTSGLIAR